MSATMTMTMAQPATAHFQMSTSPCCPKCGFNFDAPPIEDTQSALLEAQRQIEDLQAQVRLLNQKAVAAVDRWADYEDELSKLRRQVAANNAQQQAAAAASQDPPPAASPTRSSFLSSGAATRISALLSPRSAKSMSNLKTPPSSAHTSFSQPRPQVPPTPKTPFSPFPQTLPMRPGSPTPSTDDLLEALSREQSLRLAAEGKLNDTSREVEELSVQLFEQANEMVANERRARARLEERVETLERRDVEKRKRLERLEQAMERIERVRALLGQDGGVGSSGAGGERRGEGDEGGKEVR